MTQNKEIMEIANQISIFLKKHSKCYSDVQRVHSKYYDLRDCMEAILYNETNTE